MIVIVFPEILLLLWFFITKILCVIHDVATLDLVVSLSALQNPDGDPWPHFEVVQRGVLKLRTQGRPCTVDEHINRSELLLRLNDTNGEVAKRGAQDGGRGKWQDAAHWMGDWGSGKTRCTGWGTGEVARGGAQDGGLGKWQDAARWMGDWGSGKTWCTG